MLEDDFEGRLYKVVWLPKGKLSFSVTSINEKLNTFLVIFWASISFYVACIYAGYKKPEDLFLFQINEKMAILIFIIFIVLIGILWLLRQTSSLSGSLPTQTGDFGEEIKRSTLWHRKIAPKETFMLRKSPE